MVLTTTGVNHLRLGNLVSDTIAGQPVVNSPACVVDFAGLTTLRPPSVVIWHSPMQVAEGIGKALGKEIGKASPFFVCKAG